MKYEVGTVELARKIKGERRNEEKKMEKYFFLHRLIEKERVMEWVFKKSIKLAE